MCIRDSAHPQPRPLLLANQECPHNAPSHQHDGSMTYCVGVQVDEGLVFLSDSRTNAGVDDISTFRKMMFFETAGERAIVLLSAGNLATSQSVTGLLRDRVNNARASLVTARTMA